jgi:hypothetical protein
MKISNELYKGGRDHEIYVGKSELQMHKVNQTRMHKINKRKAKNKTKTKEEKVSK